MAAAPGRVVGVDGCRAGWFAVWQESERIDFGVYATVAELYSAQSHAAIILVDIPIGLTNNRPRKLEPKMRSLLGRKSSSVFSVPSKDAVYACDYQQACARNSKCFGKKISLQAWNICNKIRQMDQFLLEKPSARHLFVESHPELVFAFLAGSVLSTSKKKPAGIEERLKIIDLYNDRLKSVYHRVVQSYLRNQVARDDIVDAFALCIAAKSVRQLEVDAQIGAGGIAIRLFVPAAESLLFSPDFIC